MTTDMLWCDGCGVEIASASQLYRARHFCCSACAVGEPCRCAERQDPVPERPAATSRVGVLSQRRLAMRQLEQSREQERARIARDLHDRLGGSLTGLKLDLSRARESLLTDMVDAEARLAALSGEISRLIDMVRQIALELRPAMLDDLGLLPAMEWQFQEVIRRTGLTGDFAGDVDSARVSDEVATACFRVFQEALTNVARHASATQVQAHVGLAGESLVLHVHDNGRGLPPETAGATHHLGLASMRERTEMLSGHLDIHSAPGHGTTVVATIPLAAPTPEALAVSPDQLATPPHGPYVLRSPAWSGAPAQERFTT